MAQALGRAVTCVGMRVIKVSATEAGGGTLTVTLRAGGSDTNLSVPVLYGDAAGTHYADADTAAIGAADELALSLSTDFNGGAHTVIVILEFTVP